MEIYLYQGHYQGQTNSIYQSTYFYKIWIKQDGQNILIKKQNDTDGSSRKKYESFNQFFDEWGMIQKDCNNIKLT